MQISVTKLALGVLVLVVGISGCARMENLDFYVEQPSRKPSRSSVDVRGNNNSVSTMEKSIYEQVNQYRKSRNLPPLKLDDRISKQAKAHSQAMANGKVPFSHQGFEQRVKAIDKSINYLGAAENVAYNQGFSDPATEAVRGWLKSPGHLKNIEDNFDLTGIGVVKNAEGEYYFTQIFIRTR